MKVFDAYRESWRNRATFIPVFLAVRLLSLALIAPLIAATIQIAVSLSGQAALTDQDIASFFLSPMGFPVFVLLAGIILIGSVFGTAVMTLCLHNQETGGFRALTRALGGLTPRLPGLIRFAMELVLRVLIMVMPFALVGAAIALWLLGDYDINYYLSEKPREFILAVASGGVLGLIATLLVTSKLLNWAVALHMVLFGEARPGEAFRASTEAMKGKRRALLRDVLIWVLIRACLAALLALAVGSLLYVTSSLVGDNLRLRLGLTSGLALVLVLGGAVIGALSIGALAKILLVRYTDQSSAQMSNMAQDPGRMRPLSVVFGVTALIALGAVTALSIAPRLQSDTEIEIIAHRGASGSNPENTLAAIRAAVADRADWVEIDVQETADGEVVVIHDSDFMKLASTDLKIWDAEMRDLQNVDIGSWFDPTFADERVPTLEQALEAVRDHPSKLLIELKYYGHDVDLEARTAKIIEDMGMTDQVALMSLKYPAVQKMKGLRPDWEVGVLAATAIGDLAALEAVFEAVNAGLVTARLAKRDQAQGKRRYAWPINDPVDMSAMMSKGVDGIITDEPGLAREIVELRSSMTGVERLLLLLLGQIGLGGTPSQI